MTPSRIDVITLFPDLFAGPLQSSIVGRARVRGMVTIDVHDLRRWTTDRHKSADDTPYGGGAGMVMMAPPIVCAVEATMNQHPAPADVIFLSASGRPFTQAIAREFARRPRLILVCGHYEGIDQRAIDLLQADEISIGDYVLTGGELPALVLIDAVTRLLPGVIDHASTDDESFETGILEYPHYTRPASYRGVDVPAPLLSGHHANIARWRRERALARTFDRRPDLLVEAPLSEDDRKLLATLEDGGHEGEPGKPKPSP